MEITPEVVIERVRAAGGRLVLDGLEAEELAAWRHASKVAYLRLLRAGHERLQRFSLDNRDHYDRGKLVIGIDRDEFPIELYGDRRHALTLTIKDRHPHRRRGYDSWTDAPDRPLHSRLAEVFTHIERWADLLIQKREQEYQKQLEDERRRKQTETAARLRLTEDQRRTVLAERIAEVEFTDDARAYSDALFASADHLSPPRADEVRAWARWVREHADRLDPRRTLKGMPVKPKPNRDELRPYLPNRAALYLRQHFR